MVGFELTVLGGFGGPWDGGLQSFMLKPTGSQEYGYVCVDAGTGLKELIRLAATRGIGGKGMVTSYYENDYEPVDRFHDSSCKILCGIGTLSSKAADAFEDGDGKGQRKVLTSVEKGLELYHEIGEVFITHCHLDHIMAMVVNSPVIYAHKKSVLGLPLTIEVLKEHVFNDKIWPNLVSGDEPPFNLITFKPYESYICNSVPHWNVTCFPVSHGLTVVDRKPYYSTAYLFQDGRDGDSLLVCGDMESDRISNMSHLSEIWNYLATNIPFERVRGLVMECSTMDLKDESHLYGHMSTRHVIWELNRLKKAYGKPLDGLNVIVTHIKMESLDKDPRIIILKELREKSIEKGLGAIKFSVAIQGYTHFI
ncbi:3',5'-cyclic-nucleotide phosphodiesterase PDE1 Ecym_6009 [Eremothecium cymbalariae DBVPG|uniref:3',5'-cyclic-nucleotide phosphodiesterase n=1 Tax=Eremothecium cymbalariae (strain CBS 270.75 / DBVPG 7215 / KCTC 17166 / NRRL Y-17582) TaxID=931890 RepID=G8JUT8_ERECY|nr:hypothetical protein Ecym_6009 [Eremothecium cymbalariae DBVPG\